MQKTAKNRALRRLKILEGQIRGLQHMVAKEEYCVDIITQTLAVKQALSGVEDVILENHLSTHVVMQMRSKRPQRSINEILTIYRLAKKK